MKSTLVHAISGAALAAAAFASPASADDDNKPRRIMSLTGTGEVMAEPDMATLSLGVVKEAKTARQALSANNEAMAAVIATVTGAGIAQKDVQTSGFNISPKYHYPKRSTNGERPAPKIVGYTVSNTVSVIVRDLDKLGPVLDEVVSAGSNQVHGIAFAIDDPKPLQDEARKLATADALGKAELYAEAAGITLGAVQSITEQSHSVTPQYDAPVARAMVKEAAAVPVARGEQRITMQVHITWEIE